MPSAIHRQLDDQRQVTELDVAAVEANETSQASITNVYDFNRDGQVNATDVNIVQANMTTSANAVNLISVPALTVATPFATEQPALMETWGEYILFFAPVIVETPDGTLISVAEARTTGGDSSVQGIAETTSTDGGQTWSPVSIIATAPNFPTNVLAMGSMVVDQTTGAVFLVYTLNDDAVLLMSSTNDGQTWSAPQNISSSVMLPSWGYIGIGEGDGIQLTVGPDTGRLLVSINYRYAPGTTNPDNPSYDAVIYSDDNGSTWQLGGGPVPTDPANVGVNEAAIVQLPDGEIYMNSRLKYADNTGPARGYSFSDDGGITWSNVQYDYSLPVPSVEGSLIQLDPNTLLFAAPQDPTDTGIRQEMTIWASFNEGQTWTEERVISYDFASYSSMVALGHDTAMLEFVAGQNPVTGGAIDKIDLVKFNLAELENGQTPQFTWNFDEEPIGQAAPIGGSSIRDDGPWDERGTVESTGGIPFYVPGSNGDEALQIVNGSNVVLSPALTYGLQFSAGQSFTFQFVLRTTSANGVLLGEMPGDPGYTFSLVNGAITLNLNDGKDSETLTGTTIDDGAWHDVVGVRNAANGTVSLYVDGSLVATAADTTGDLVNYDNVTLGSYANGSSQLTFDIDLVQATRAALTPSQFLTSSYVPPQTLPAPTTPANNVLSLPGLGFYLPPYDDRHYFADLNESDPLLIQPTPGTVARSAIDATNQYYVQGTSGGTVYYETNPTVGSYWSSQAGTGWSVINSNGTQSPSRNFDFVQNTETFTISDVFNVPSVPTDGSLELIGNNNNTSALPGFYLGVNSSGDLNFNITDGTGDQTSLVDQTLATYSYSNNSLPQLSTGGWYQIVIVGNGPGTPLQYYLTPMTATQVQQYQTSQSMTAIATPTATGATQNLQIANVGDSSATGPPTVNFKDLAIFNQALTPAQVSQLFLDEAIPPVVTASGTINTFTVGGAAMPVDSGLTVSSGDADLTGATVTISSGTLQSGDLLNFTNQNGISGSYAGGVLTLSGSATPAQYQSALQSVTFSTTSTNTTSRAISVVAADDSLTSSSAAEQVNVSTALPVLTASGTTSTFTVGGAAVAVDSGLAGSPSGTDLTGATVTISSGTLQSGDVLNFTNQYGISGSYSGGVLTLTGSATVAQYVAALQSVTFSTKNISITTRSLSIVASDGGLESNAVAEQIVIATPVVAASGMINTFTVGAQAVTVDSGVVVLSNDTDLTGATVTISSGTLQSGDALNFTNQNGIRGSYSAGVLTLTGSATVAQYAAALQSVTFSTTTAIVGSRSIAIVALDNTLTSDSAAETVKVSTTAVTASGSTASYTAGAAAVAVDPGVTVASYGANLIGATMTISAGTLQSGDVLNFTNQNGISGSYSAGVLTLSGSATPAQYQAALQSVTFSNSTNKATTTRSISTVAHYSSMTSNSAAEQVNVDAPITITGTYVSGSTWSSTFDSYLAKHSLGSATYGYALQTGSNQLTTLPWANINQITVTFSGAVSDVGPTSLKLAGGSGGSTPSVTGFTSDGGNTYSWTLSGPLTNNRYVIGIASTGSSFGPAVVDANGAGISGTFATGQAFPSGNGLAGSTFDFFFDVLPGDTNRDANDNATDINNIRPLSSGTRSTSSSYNPYYDLLGAGIINATTLNTIRPLTGRLESANPTAPSASQGVGTTGFVGLELGVQETGGSTSLATGSSTSSSSASAVSNVASAPLSSSTTSAVTKSTTGSGSEGTSSTTGNRDHGRHRFTLIDEAVSDFELADLWV